MIFKILAMMMLAGKIKRRNGKDLTIAGPWSTQRGLSGFEVEEAKLRARGTGREKGKPQSEGRIKITKIPKATPAIITAIKKKTKIFFDDINT